MDSNIDIIYEYIIIILLYLCILPAGAMFVNCISY